jgi:hypothetical protein
MTRKQRRLYVVTAIAQVRCEQTEGLRSVAKAMQEENPARAPLLHVYRFCAFSYFEIWRVFGDHPAG